MIPTPAFDPIQVEVWRHLLAAIAEEMGGALQRTAYSPNIKERLDHSCALFDARGRLLAQAAHIPVHLGAMPLMLQTLRTAVQWQPGVMWLCNDPRYGGTHLPDLTLVAPVYSEASGIRHQASESREEAAPNAQDTTRQRPAIAPVGTAVPNAQDTTPDTSTRRRLIGFVASRAHHADIGGLSPGSLPLSSELFHEGLILPPVRLVERYRVREDILQLVCANSRTPAERRGDLAAQIAANETGVRRFQALAAKYGLAEFRKRTQENIAYAAAAVRKALADLPPGTYSATDMLDGDGFEAKNISIAVTITVRRGGRITFDFTGSAPQVKGSLNAPEAITRSACYYLARCLVQEEIPTNTGCFAPVTVIAPEGSVVNPRFPAPVAAGNVETSQRIVDVLLKALALAVPERIPAASQGTMNNLTIGGFDPIRNHPFAYYETIAGGAGASAAGDGAPAVHSHMTNTRNTPVEALETHYPLRVRAYSLVENTGGAGRHRGGDGLIRRIELLAESRVSLLAERRDHPPFGANGGEAGICGADSIQLPGQAEQPIPGKWSGDCPAGTIVTIRAPGGGGWGQPKKKAEKTAPEA